MLGKPVAVFSCISGQRHAALQQGLFAAAQHPRTKKWKGEISSLDVQRQRAMLPPKKMFRKFAGFVPGRHRRKQDVWGETHEDTRRRRVRSKKTP
jgi:hypothetical protein